MKSELVEDKYSVLMSVYKNDRAEYVKLAIDSMMNQTVMPEQFVIVEDGPIDRAVAALIDHYVEQSPALFTVIRLSQNGGLGKALDRGLKSCRNELVARMDADDISLLDRCERQLNVFRAQSEVAICSGTIAEFIADPKDVVSYRLVPERHEEIKKQMRIRSGFNHPAVMYKKSEVLRCGGYGKLKRKQDHDLFSRMLSNECIGYNIQSPILYFRSDGDNLKRRKSWVNCSSYIIAQWHCFRRGEVSVGDLWYVITAQIFFLLAPRKLVDKVTKRYLRSI